MLCALVLDGIVVAGFGGEGDTNCAGSFHSSRVSLAMSPARHHGYHDITVVERKDTDDPSADKDGECQSHPGKSVSRTYRLRYDGSRYHGSGGAQGPGSRETPLARLRHYGLVVNRWCARNQIFGAFRHRSLIALLYSVP